MTTPEESLFTITTPVAQPLLDYGHAILGAARGNWLRGINQQGVYGRFPQEEWVEWHRHTTPVIEDSSLLVPDLSREYLFVRAEQDRMLIELSAYLETSFHDPENIMLAVSIDKSGARPGRLPRRGSFDFRGENPLGHGNVFRVQEYMGAMVNKLELLNVGVHQSNLA